jgi:hypothetical protein
LLGLAAFVVLVAGVAMAYLQLRRQRLPQMVAGVLLAGCVAIAVVALITQEQCVIWALLGATSGALARGRWSDT